MIRNKLSVVYIILILRLFGQMNFVHSFDNVLNDYYGNNTEYYVVNFNDINEVLWATESISYLAKHNIISGNNGMFYPMDYITRDEFVKILILGFGLYDESATCDFIDVPKESWHYPYIASAKKLGITSGINSKEFGVDEPITRQQMITLAYNTAKYCGINFEKFNDNSFVDFNEISLYAKEAVLILAQSGIVNGNDSNEIQPNKNATRAEASKIIYSILIKNT